MSKRGPRPHTRRSPPDDFAQVAPTKCLKHLREHYAAGVETVRRWCKELAVAPASERIDAAQVPDDFASLAPTMGVTALQEHYGKPWGVIHRWLKKAGVEAKPYDNKAPKQGHRQPGCYHRKSLAEKRAHRGAFSLPRSGVAHTLPRDTSHEGRAADHLRRFAPLYRCDEHGRPHQRGTHWSYGYSDPLILTPQEMVDKAEARGFRADAWAQLAGVNG